MFSCSAVKILSSVSAVMDEKGREGAIRIPGFYLLPDGEDLSLRLVLCKQRSLTCSLKTMTCTLSEIYGDLDSSAGAYDSAFPVGLASSPSGREAALLDE